MANAKNLILGAVAALSLAACSNKPAEPVNDISLYTLKNPNGMEVDVTNIGGRIVSIRLADRDGKIQDVCLGFEDINNYADVKGHPSDFGSSVGRYANRINKGIITVDGKEIQLPQNNFGHCLHGGPTGWQYQLYTATQPNDSVVVLTLHSPDGDNNFPGNVDVKVTYTLTSENAIEINYEGTTDATTVLNMTNHTYFNLNGGYIEPITNHIMTLNADYFTPVDSTYMTTGEIRSVEGTLFDFRQPKEVGADITEDNLKNDEQLRNGNGYDHNWVLNTKGDATQVCARVTSPKTGITLEVYTNEPGLQVYSGNFLDGSLKGKGGKSLNQRCGICLESQKFPDSPNKYQLPGWELCNPYLHKGETYKSYCKFAFSVEK